MRCPSCGSDTTQAARFCAQCGARLVVEGAAASQGERRQLTVMFCDLVESTQLSTRLDAEDLREAVRAHHEACESILRGFDAQVAQYLGDGLLIYFGYPRAHEDDPDRALHAALRILEETPRVNARLEERIPLIAERPLQVRVGVHTGPVVVAAQGEGSQRERLAWGDTVNLAARLQAATDPDSVLISDATRRLVREHFDVEPLGERRFKGMGEGVPVYRVRGLRATPLPLASRATPLIARRAELAVLGKRWEAAAAGHGGALLLRGEAGFGKSRLVEAFRAQISEQPHLWLQFHGSAYRQSSAFHPVIEGLRELLGLRDEEGTARQQQRLERGLGRAGLRGDEPRRLVGRLLSFVTEDEGSPTSPEGERQRTLETLAAWCLRVSKERPVAIIAEDLHWLDPSTLELIAHLVERMPATRILLIATSRPGFDAPWMDEAKVTRIDLAPFDAADALALIRSIPGAAALPQGALEEIVRRTDGVPLFVEEFARNVIEAFARSGGQPGVPWRVAVEIPATLQDSLMARLDRLGPTRSVAQLASALGREFPLALLERIAGIDATLLQRAVDELVEAGLLVHREAGAGTRYSFRHNLLQLAAYESLLRGRRKEIHESVVEALLEHFPGTVASSPELVAQHCRDADLVSDAIHWWTVAAKRARERHALHEEIAHLQSALELLQERVPASPERDARELDARISLAQQLIATSGLASPVAQSMISRIRALCVASGSPTKLYAVLMLQAMLRLARADNAAALALTDEVEQLLREVDAPELRPSVALIRGGALGATGRIEESIRELENGIATLDSEIGARIPPQQRLGVRIMSQSLLAYNLWLVGRPDQAKRVVDDALALGPEAGSQPQNHAQALIAASEVAMLRRDVEAAERHANELVEFSLASNLPAGVAHGNFFRGWAAAEKGRLDEGVALMREGLAQRAELGTAMRLTLYLARLANVCARAGRSDEGHALLAEAHAHVKQSGEIFYLAELHRVRGELALRSGSDAEVWYRRALESARSIGARMTELLAASALCRLDPDAPCRELELAYARIEDGFDLADLREARELLDARSAAAVR
jgi:class 3 adenylate cyclase/predicted ATPase